MKKILALGLTIMLLLTSLLAACQSGTPKAPVSKQLDLDKLVTENMTLSQVNDLMSPALKSTYILYQAETITSSGTGDSKSWSVKVPKEGYAAGETGEYQVMFFHPEKSRTEFYTIFFKNNVCIGKAWFSGSYGLLIEQTLKGER